MSEFRSCALWGEMICAWKKLQIVCEGGRGGVVIGARGRRRRRRRRGKEGDDDETETGAGAERQQMRVRDTWMAVIGSRMTGPWAGRPRRRWVFGWVGSGGGAKCEKGGKKNRCFFFQKKKVKWDLVNVAPVGDGRALFLQYFFFTSFWCEFYSNSRIYFTR